MHHARRQRADESQRIADRDDELPNSQCARIARCDGGQSGGFDFEGRQIAARVTAHERRFVRAAIPERYFGAGIASDVGIRDNDAVLAPDDSRPASLPAAVRLHVNGGRRSCSATSPNPCVVMSVRPPRPLADRDRGFRQRAGPH